MPLIRLTHKQLEAARESQLTFQRRAVLNQLRQLRPGVPPSSHPQPAESEPVDPEISASNEPEANLQPVVSIAPPPPAGPGKCPETGRPEAA